MNGDLSFKTSLCGHRLVFDKPSFIKLYRWVIDWRNQIVFTLVARGCNLIKKLGMFFYGNGAKTYASKTH